MDIKAYIESGILESYVMRLTSSEETAEVESMIAAHPEIAAAVTSFEISLEQQLLSSAVAPPANIKQQLMDQLAPEFSPSAKIIPTAPSEKVVNMRTATPVWKYVAAASIVLLLGSGWLNMHYYSKYNEVQNEYQNLLADRNSLMAKQDANQAKMTEAEGNIRMMLDAAVKKVVMLSPDQNNIATVYWDTRTKDVFVAKNKLPNVPQGKQYQLWALIKGQPVNAGMISDCGQVLCKMINIAEADAFAITLEKEGGSPTPDLSQLQVIGKI